MLAELRIPAVRAFGNFQHLDWVARKQDWLRDADVARHFDKQAPHRDMRVVDDLFDIVAGCCRDAAFAKQARGFLLAMPHGPGFYAGTKQLRPVLMPPRTRPEQGVLQ